MRRIRLYIAASLDGFIARRDGAIDWLSSVEKAGEDYGYTEFLGSIDTTLMGYATYAQVLTFGAFPYSEQKNYVFSRQQRPPDGNPVTFVAEDPAAFVSRLRQQPGGDIWLIGGGQLNAVLLQAGLVDELILSIIPVALGDGIPLFGGQPATAQWKLLEHKVFDTGLVQVKYGRA
ncbi:MAG: dihydrofolate reductase [Phaeodactylibacter sp.]|nr:dihydrofolate reductase [Phaeodactylibacter sp.]MCB9275209.1 dihydrofolate reductase [Lewinellaceae bacterium]